VVLSSSRLIIYRDTNSTSSLPAPPQGGAVMALPSEGATDPARRL
jgi:hypothetical protein